MTTQIKMILAVLLVVAAGTGIYLFGTADSDPVVVAGENDPEADPNGKQAAEVKGDGRQADPTSGNKAPEIKRTVAEHPAGEGKEYRQGVKGRVVNEFGNPVAGAEVYLMPGLGLKVMKMFKQHQEGVRFPPVARSVTGADGAFILGIEKWEDGAQFEVRAKHPDYCDHRLPNVEPQPEDWVEATVTMKKGVAVFGRVTTESGLPIPGATVMIRDGSGQINLTPMPGRENGLTVETDQSGAYELPNIDPVGIFSMSAIAANYAKEEKSELQLAGAQRHQHDFKLAPGLDIAGTVVNTQGKPVRDAKITVSALSQKSRIMEMTATDEDGYFVVPGLKAGPYAVMVAADGYLSIDDKPVKAGVKTLEYTLEQQGRVFITVLDTSGRPVSNYHCNLKTAFKGQDTYGNTLISKPVKGARNGTVEISGINPMTYVAEVFANGFAKNFSERFTITESQAEPPRITVQLNRGGTVAGIISDNKGNPIPGVRIVTRPHGMIDNPFLAIFPIPYTITKRDGKTDKNGRFEFKLLYPGKYQLKFEHPEYCTDYAKDVVVAIEQRVDLNELTMTRGCIVSGIARVEGNPSGQVKVTVSAVPDPKNPVPFSAEAISDNEGRFLLNKRLMPGRYEVMAAQQVQANPLLMMVQFNKSKKEIFIPANREHFELKVDVPKIN